MLPDFQQINKLLKGGFRFIIKYPMLCQMDIQKASEKVAIKPCKVKQIIIGKGFLYSSSLYLSKTTGVTG